MSTLANSAASKVVLSISKNRSYPRLILVPILSRTSTCHFWAKWGGGGSATWGVSGFSPGYISSPSFGESNFGFVRQQRAGELCLKNSGKRLVCSSNSPRAGTLRFGNKQAHERLSPYHPGDCGAKFRRRPAPGMEPRCTRDACKPYAYGRASREQRSHSISPIPIRASKLCAGRLGILVWARESGASHRERRAFQPPPVHGRPSNLAARHDRQSDEPVDGQIRQGAGERSRPLCETPDLGSLGCSGEDARHQKKRGGAGPDRFSIRPEAALQELRGSGIGARASEHGALWCAML